MTNLTNSTPPIVFISYSWTSEDHKAWVLELATNLRNSGVDIKLDRWELKGGHDTIDFMEEMVKNTLVERVLIICDSGYKEKADKRKGGVGIESQIISGKVYKDVKQEKFIPIIRERDHEGKTIVQIYLENRMYIDFSDDEYYGEKLEELLRQIFNAPELEKPPLGPPPSFIDDTKRQLPKYGNWIMFKNAILADKSTASGMFTTWTSSFISSFGDFVINKDDIEGIEPGKFAYDQIKEFTFFRDHYVEVIDFLTLYEDNIRYYEEIHQMIEKIWYFTRPKEQMSAYKDPWYEHMRFILYELFLYTIAILINYRRFDQANYLLSEPYLLNDEISRNKSQPYWEFYFYGSNLESFVNTQYQNEYKKTNNLLSPTAELIYQCATLEKYPINKLIEVETILWLRDFRWKPYSLIYANGGVLEIFSRASSKREFKNLLLLLNCSDKNEIQEKAYKSVNSREFRKVHIHYPDEFNRIINFDNLNTIGQLL